MLVSTHATGFAIVSDTSGHTPAPPFLSRTNRLAHAWNLRSPKLFLAPLPAVRPKIVFRRDVRERVAAIVPFLTVGPTIAPVVRLYLASGAQRLSITDRAPIVEALLQHAEDADDHNLPLMYWYAAEPVAGADIKAAALMAAKSKIPRVREYISRRMAASVSK